MGVWKGAVRAAVAGLPGIHRANVCLIPTRDVHELVVRGRATSGLELLAEAGPGGRGVLLQPVVGVSGARRRRGLDGRCGVATLLRPLLGELRGDGGVLLGFELHQDGDDERQQEDEAGDGEQDVGAVQVGMRTGLGQFGRPGPDGTEHGTQCGDLGDVVDAELASVEDLEHALGECHEDDPVPDVVRDVDEVRVVLRRVAEAEEAPAGGDRDKHQHEPEKVPVVAVDGVRAEQRQRAGGDRQQDADDECQEGHSNSFPWISRIHSVVEDRRRGCDVICKLYNDSKKKANNSKEGMLLQSGR